MATAALSVEVPADDDVYSLPSSESDGDQAKTPVRTTSARARPESFDATPSGRGARVRDDSPESARRAESPGGEDAPQYFFDEEGQGWVSYRDRPLHGKPAKSQQRPARAQRPQSAGVRRMTRKRYTSKEHKRMARLDRLSRPKQHPSQDVSSIIGDCENCTFNPQVTRYAAQMDGPEFMERLPRYTAAYMQKKNHTAEVDFSFAPELNVVREDGSKPDRDEFFRKMEADIQKRRRKAEEAMRGAPSTTKMTAEQRRKKQEDFERRLESDLKKRSQRHPKDYSQQFAFRPKVSKGSQRVQTSDFYERMTSDIRQRQAKLDAARKAQRAGMGKPQSYSRKGKGEQGMSKAEKTEAFMIRLEEDLQRRKDGLQALKDGKMLRDKDYTFAPKISNYAKNNAKGSFIARYEADLDERREKLEETQRMLSKPMRFPKKSHTHK